MVSGVKTTVALLETIQSYWVNSSINACLNGVVRRYIGTFNGIFMAFPGTVVNKGFEHTHTPWYINAL